MKQAGFALALLAGCGGGGTAALPDPGVALAEGSTLAGSLANVTADGAGTGVTRQAVEIAVAAEDRIEVTIDGQVFSAAFDAASGSYLADNGALVARDALPGLSTSAMLFVELARETALSDTGFLVAGTPAAAADLPMSGAARYLGVLSGQATDGARIAGTVDLSVDWAGAAVTGAVEAGATALRLADGAIDGAGFDGLLVSPAAGGPVGDISGGFFGPDGAEAGGTLTWHEPDRGAAALFGAVRQ